MGEPARLGPVLRELLEDPRHSLCFIVASLLEAGVQGGPGGDGFQVQPSLLRRSLLDGGFEEIPIEAAHVLAVAQLPPLHRDPFDRLLVVQEEWEGLMLITADALLARYPGPVRHQGSF